MRTVLALFQGVLSSGLGGPTLAALFRSVRVQFDNVCSLALLSSRRLLLWFYQNRTVPIPVASSTLFRVFFSLFQKINSTACQVVCQKKWRESHFL